MDFEKRVMRMETSDGSIEAPLPPSLENLNTNLRSVVIDIEGDQLVIRLPNNVEAVVELGTQGPADSALLAGRRVVYLDQNQWSAMAAWRHGHRPISSSEAGAAQRLAELVSSKEIVLPFSAGNLVETVPLFDERRVALASTVLELSRGWQVRNPVEIRREELMAALSGKPPIASGVASLGADVLFTQSLNAPDGSNLPQPFAAAMPRFVNVASLYEVLVDRDQVPDQGGREAAIRWAQGFADLANRLKQDGFSKGGYPRDGGGRRAYRSRVRDCPSGV